MATTPEGKIKKAIKDVLLKYGLSYQMPVTNGYGSSGYPDFTICAWGAFITIEAKADAKKKGPTPLQKVRMEEIRKSGGITLVVDCHNIHRLEVFFSDIRCVTCACDGDVNIIQCKHYAIQHGLWYSETHDAR